MKLETIDGKQYQFLNEVNGCRYLLSTSNKIVVELHKCPSCAAAKVLSHPDLKKLCNECGKKWRNYYYQKSLFHKGADGGKYLDKYSSWVDYWYQVSISGMYAPADIAEQKEIVEQHKAERRALQAIRDEAKEEVDIRCYRCTKTSVVLVNSAEEAQGIKYICPACEGMYSRYKALRRKVAVLTDSEQNELWDIIRWYLNEYKNDRWCPASSDKLVKVLREMYGR